MDLEDDVIAIDETATVTRRVDPGRTTMIAGRQQPQRTRRVRAADDAAAAPPHHAERAAPGHSHADDPTPVPLSIQLSALSLQLSDDEGDALRQERLVGLHLTLAEADFMACFAVPDHLPSDIYVGDFCPR